MVEYESMKSLTKELWMNVPTRRAIVSIHDDVARLVAESGVREGLCLVKAWHSALPVCFAPKVPQR